MSDTKSMTKTNAPTYNWEDVPEDHGVHFKFGPFDVVCIPNRSADVWLCVHADSNVEVQAFEDHPYQKGELVKITSWGVTFKKAEE